MAMIGSILVSGCATSSSLPAYTFEPASPTHQAQEKDGLRVVVDPFFDSARSDKYFDVNAASRGLVVLFIRVENARGGPNYLVQKEAFRLNTSGSHTVEKDSGASDAVMLTGLALISLPLLFVGGAISTHSERVQHNFVVRELRNQTVNAGGVAEGFIYYQLKESDLKTKELSLTIPVTNTTTQTTITFSFKLRYENK